MSDEVLVERRDGVQIITINRPQAKNALNLAVARAVADAVDELDASDDLRVGVLTGAGGTFSAGMDLKAFLRGESPAIEGRGLAGITITPPKKPLIGAVEGWALAGGFELMLACDLVVAGDTARFGVPEVTRSLVAAAGGALLLPRRIPYAIAMEMLLTGDPITARRGAEIGLVNRLVPEGKALEGALELAARVAAAGPWPSRPRSGSPAPARTGRSPRAGRSRSGSSRRCSSPRTRARVPPRSRRSAVRCGAAAEGAVTCRPPGPAPACRSRSRAVRRRAGRRPGRRSGRDHARPRCPRGAGARVRRYVRRTPAPAAAERRDRPACRP